MAAMDPTDELRQKLQAIDGDKTATKEMSTSVIDTNKAKINSLRQENKNMVTRLRAMKNPGKSLPGARMGPEAIDSLDHTVCNKVKRHNQVRAKAETREKELLALQKKHVELATDLQWLRNNDEGNGKEAKQIRSLETKLDKAMIKKREAVHIGNTYKQIILKLNDDRLAFDNQLKDLEKTLSERRHELNRLEKLCSDAITARDSARTDLMDADKAANADREKREKRKRDLLQAAEEQRRKYEAIEMRLRNSSQGLQEDDNGKNDSNVRDKLVSSEDMLRSIQEATGVMDVHEVLQRFRSQNETETKLKRLQDENTTQLKDLNEKLAAAKKTYESLKYSGEARNTSNQRMVAEFEQHLTAAKTQAEDSESVAKRNANLLIQVETGINHLHDKLETLKPVQFRAASLTKDKIKESELRLVELINELEQRKGELVDVDATEAPLVLPENNTRVVVKSAADDGKKKEEDDEGSDDEDAISREQVKKLAQQVYESNMANAPPGGKKKR